MAVKRMDRINSELQTEIAKIVNYELGDGRLQGIISIIRVETDNDLNQSLVYVSIYNKNKDEVKSCFNALLDSAGYIRKLLAARLKLRTVPSIKFILDTSMEYSEKINNILSKIEIPEEE